MALFGLIIFLIHRVYSVTQECAKYAGITQELCKSNAELCNLVAKTSTAISKQTTIFIVHQIEGNELANTVAET
jgi:hypothetical protein